MSKAEEISERLMELLDSAINPPMSVEEAIDVCEEVMMQVSSRIDGLRADLKGEAIG